MESLGKIGDETVIASVTRLLRDPSPLVRSAAAKATGRLGGASAREVVPALLQSLKDPSDEVRQVAAQAIGELDSQPLLLSGIADLLTAPQTEVRRAAALALLQIEPGGLVVFLHRAMQDSDAVVRQRAVAALGESGLSEAVPWLRERLLTDQDVGVRAEAAYRLRAESDEETRAVLQRAAETDGDPVVRLWAARG